MSCPLSKELRSEHNIRSLPVRKGDTIKVMRGFYKGKEGKVKHVNRMRWSIWARDIKHELYNGQTVGVALNASNCMITEIHSEFKDRQEIIDRKKAGSAGAKDAGID